MIWDVRWENQAAEELRRLARRDQSMARRIGQAVTRLATSGHGDVVKLSGGAEVWRLRVGTWRVRFRFDHPEHAIVILRVLLRREAYRD